MTTPERGYVKKLDRQINVEVGMLTWGVNT